MKDILNSLYPLEAPASDAPAEGDVAGAPAAEAGETGETAEATVEGVEPTSEPASEAVVAASPSSGTPMDNMETLPLMPDGGPVCDSWPPRPWIPKSSLRRWLSKRTSTIEDFTED